MGPEALRDFLNRWSNFFAVEQFHKKNNKKIAGGAIKLPGATVYSSYFPNLPGSNRNFSLFVFFLVSLKNIQQKYKLKNTLLQEIHKINKQNTVSSKKNKITKPYLVS